MMRGESESVCEGEEVEEDREDDEGGKDDEDDDEEGEDAPMTLANTSSSSLSSREIIRVSDMVSATVDCVVDQYTQGG
jgi:hypothetical protein